MDYFQSYRVWVTIRSLVEDRLYTIPEEISKIATFEDWKNKYFIDNEFKYSNLDNIYTITSQGKEKYGETLLSDRLYVVWTDEQKLNLPFINKLTLQMITNKIYQALILYGNSLTDKAKREIAYPTIYGEGSISTTRSSEIIKGEKTYPVDLRIETLLRDSYVVNITKHSIQPKFELMSQSEKEQVLIILKTKVNKLPRIHSIDPIARYYGLIRGQIVKITRVNEIITYRVVY